VAVHVNLEQNFDIKDDVSLRISLSFMILIVGAVVHHQHRFSIILTHALELDDFITDLTIKEQTILKLILEGAEGIKEALHVLTQPFPQL
jgi:hypothetical protein